MLSLLATWKQLQEPAISCASHLLVKLFRGLLFLLSFEEVVCSSILITLDEDLIDVVDVLSCVHGFDDWEDFFSISTHCLIRKVLPSVAKELVDVGPTIRIFKEEGIEGEGV